MKNTFTDVSGQEIPACFGFDYRGYTITISTLYKVRSIAIWKDDRSSAERIGEFSVEEAIIWIDKQIVDRAYSNHFNAVGVDQ